MRQVVYETSEALTTKIPSKRKQDIDDEEEESELLHDKNICDLDINKLSKQILNAEESKTNKSTLNK